jgi:hypothetical protein
VRARGSRLGRHYDCGKCGYKRVLYQKLKLWTKLKADLGLLED